MALSYRAWQRSRFGAPILCILALVVFSPRFTGADPDRDGYDRTETDDRQGDISVAFSPGGECSRLIVDEIENATDRIRVQVYIFTSKRIADALAAAKKRRVKVEVILDKSQEKQTYGVWRRLNRDGVKVYFDGQHATANNKIILIDDHTVITGSFNFTKAAEEKNAENMVVIRGRPEVFKKYSDNYEKHREHAKKAGG